MVAVTDHGLAVRTLRNATVITTCSAFLIGSSVFGHNLFHWVDPIFPDTGLWSVVELIALIGPLLLTMAFWMALAGGDTDE